MPQFRTRQRSMFLFIFALLIAAGFSSGCFVKTSYQVPVPANLAQDKIASFEELMKIAGANDSLKSLQCSKIKATLTLGKVESGKLDEFRRASGYILLKRPDLLSLSISRPIGGGALLELSSKEDQFEAWFRGKIYAGKNSAKGELVPDNGEEFKLPARPQHLFDAIMPPPIEPTGVFVSLEEQTGPKLNSDEITEKQKNKKRQQMIETARYYVLSFSRLGAGNRIHVFRKIWIERAGLSIARQQVYSKEGQIISDIQYFNQTPFDGFSLPLIINMDRPADGYSLKLEFEGWKINPDHEDKDFVIDRPGAETIRLIEKNKEQ
jgi:outer membrane lipoprotein-sorting protein